MDGAASEVTNGRQAGAHRVLVTGASGLIGRELMELLKNGRDGWIVQGLCSTRQWGDLVPVDLTQPDKLEKAVMGFKPDIVVHLAAVRRPEEVSSNAERARKLNVDSVAQLATICERNGMWLIFVSTDYVFDGTAPPYGIDREPHPLNLYGEQKVKAENYILEKCPSAAILRVPLLYGKVLFLGESSVTELFEKLSQGKLKEADCIQKRYPTHCGDVAKVITGMLELRRSGLKKPEELGGIFHWQSEECLTKHDMVRIIGEIAGMDTQHITASNSALGTGRPEDTRLDCSRLEGLLKEAPNGDISAFRRNFRDGLKEGLAKELEKYVGNSKCTKLMQEICGGREIILDRRQLSSLLKILTPELHEADLARLLDAAEAEVTKQNGIPFAAFVNWIFH